MKRLKEYSSRRTLVRRSKIRFTKHAREKFEFVKRYCFEIDEEKVIEAIKNPTRLDQKRAQYFVIRIIEQNML